MDKKQQMIKHINFSEFCDSFSEDRKGTFSYEGKRALFDYLEMLEEDTGEPIELDIIALCCDYTEYENLDEIKADYSKIKSMKDLEDNTTVIRVDEIDDSQNGRIIIANF